MAYNAITNTEIQVKKPGRQELMQKIKDNFDYLYGTMVGFIGVLNGSFEIDSDSDNIPDGWIRQLYAGGSGGYDTVTPIHGAKTYKFVHPGGAGNGGGYLESDYILASWLLYYFGFLLKCTVPGIKVQVILRCFGADKVSLGSDQTIYDSVTNPTVWNLFSAQIALPAATRYVKIRIVGGNPDTNVAGTVFFDNVIFNEVVAQSGLKMGTTTWSVVVPALTYAAATLVEYSHLPKQTGTTSSLLLWASTSIAPLGTQMHVVIAYNNHASAPATWSGTSMYHSDSEQIIVTVKDVSGEIIGVCVTEKGNENCIRFFKEDKIEIPVTLEVLTAKTEFNFFDCQTKQCKVNADEIITELKGREKKRRLGLLEQF